MKILLISPYHSGSHQQWAEGYMKHSEHDVQLLALPGKNWKWRMQGGAVTLARLFGQQHHNFQPDLILVDDMLDLTTFLALTRQQQTIKHVPVALYMHENQLTYPLHHDPLQGAMRRHQGKRDRHLVFINYSSMLAADHIYFNSQYHLESWFTALPNFLKNYPDLNELETIQQLRDKSSVLYVGIDTIPTPDSSIENKSMPPLILWNQRWEYDKDPDAFLAALLRLHEEGVHFQVAFCGENFSQNPVAFANAIEVLGEKVVHVGFASNEKYASLLQNTTLTFSTAKHEFFGISMVESMLHGSMVFLPRRLSYPELVPASLSSLVFYEDHVALVAKLKNALTNHQQTQQHGDELKANAQQFTWEQLASKYDQEFFTLVSCCGK
eukprot:scaffold10372_cov44-Attheya_sp.AAC.2